MKIPSEKQYLLMNYFKSNNIKQFGTKEVKNLFPKLSSNHIGALLSSLVKTKKIKSLFYRGSHITKDRNVIWELI